MPERTDQPPEQPSPRACGDCKGDCGKTVDTSSNGKTIQTWQNCEPCHGTGVQGGGI